MTALAGASESNSDPVLVCFVRATFIGGVNFLHLYHVEKRSMLALVQSRETD